MVNNNQKKIRKRQSRRAANINKSIRTRRQSQKTKGVIIINSKGVVIPIPNEHPKMPKVKPPKVEEPKVEEPIEAPKEEQKIDVDI